MATDTSAAKQLGKRGGKSTAAKRTKEQRSEAAKVAAKKRWEQVRSENEPDVRVFERVLQNEWFFPSNNSRERYSDRFAQVLVSAGYAEPGSGSMLEYRYYQPTEAGISWWISARLEMYEQLAVEYPRSATRLRGEADDLRDNFEGQGMGNQLRLWTNWQGVAIFKAMRDGLLSLVSYQDYCGMPHGAEEYITAKITEKGYRYFGSLPRFVEVWE